MMLFLHDCNTARCVEIHIPNRHLEDRLSMMKEGLYKSLVSMYFINRLIANIPSMISFFIEHDFIS